MLIVSSWIAIIIVISIFSKFQWPNQKELSRKIVHIGIGPLVPLAWWIGITKNVAIGIALTITIFLFINRRWQLITAIEDVKRKSYGTVAYAFSISLLLILFWEKSPAAACVLLL